MIEGAVYSQVFRSGDAREYWTYRDGKRVDIALSLAVIMIQKGARDIKT